MLEQWPDMLYCCVLQSFMTALLHHRPHHPAKYLIKCLQYVKQNNIQPQYIIWDTFLHLSPDEGGNDTRHLGGSQSRLPPLPRNIDMKKHIDENISMEKTQDEYATKTKGQINIKLNNDVINGDADPLSVTDSVAENEEGEGDDIEDEDQGKAVLNSLDQKTKDILRGALDDLPAMSSNIVRIFLSSTFSGTLRGMINYDSQHLIQEGFHL